MDVETRHGTGRTLSDLFKAVAAFGFECYQKHGRGLAVEIAGSFQNQEGHYAGDTVYHICDAASPKLPIEIVELLQEYDPVKECISVSPLGTKPFGGFILLKSPQLSEHPGDIYKIECQPIEIISEMIAPPGTVYELDEIIPSLTRGKPGVMPGKYAFLYEDTAKLFLMKMDEFHNEYDFGEVVEVHLDFWPLLQPTGATITVPDIDSELEDDDYNVSDPDSQ